MMELERYFFHGGGCPIHQRNRTGQCTHGIDTNGNQISTSYSGKGSLKRKEKIEAFIFNPSKSDKYVSRLFPNVRVEMPYNLSCTVKALKNLRESRDRV